MSYQTIRAKCTNCVALFDRKWKFGIDEDIEMVRIYNTVVMARLEERDSVFSTYDRLFCRLYLIDITKKIDATLSMGMGFYSHKYDLTIGGALTNPNSRFRIEN